MENNLKRHSLTYLGHFTNLKSLWLPNVTKECLQKISTCVGLRELRISSMVLGSKHQNVYAQSHHEMFRHRMTGISKLRHLDLFFLAQSNIGKLTSLLGLPLRQIKLYNCAQIKTLNGIQNSPLVSCEIDTCNMLEDISLISEVTTLEWFSLNRCRDVVTVPTFKPHNKIKHLEFEASSIRTIDFLVNCCYLERLNLCLCEEVRDISVLQHCPKLLQLDISETNVENIEVVSKLQNLQDLDLHECAFITDISPVQHCHFLVYLNLTGVGNLCEYGTSVSDVDFFTPLSGLRNLKRLIVCRNHQIRGSTEMMPMSPAYMLKHMGIIDKQVNFIETTCWLHTK